MSHSSILAIIAGALLLPLTIITMCFVVEVIFGLKRSWVLESSKAMDLDVAVLIPAHDEEQIIGRTLMGLQESTGASFRILVVADNCSDSTAAVARRCGVQVAERVDPTCKGKGFALDHGRTSLRADPPQIVIVLDADCTIDGKSLDALTEVCFRTGSACQAVYLLSYQPQASPFVQISTFAFFIKNLIRQRGLQRLTGRVHLTGTGMAFPWAIFDAASLASASIVEDLQLGLNLAAEGRPPQLAENAIVWSSAADESETLVQRRRWEGGFLTTAFAAAPKVIATALRARDWRGIIAGADLLVPPVALLMLINLAAVAVLAPAAFLSAPTGVLGTLWIPLVIQMGVIGAAGAVILIAWAREGKAFISLRTLALVPLYLLVKLPFYLSLARHGVPRNWVRTQRTETHD